MDDWVTLLYSENWHNSVNQIYLILKKFLRSSDHGSAETNLTSIHEDTGLIHPEAKFLSSYEYMKTVSWSSRRGAVVNESD